MGLKLPGKITREAFEGALEKIYNEYRGLPYEEWEPEMGLGWLGWNNFEARKSLFCSEFIALVFREMGVIKDLERLENNYMPKAFSTEEPSIWVDDIQYGNEFYMNNPQTDERDSDNPCAKRAGGCQCLKS